MHSTWSLAFFHAGDNIEPPNAPTVTGTDVITYTWTHNSSSLVDYYSLTVGGDMLENQTIHLNMTEFELPPNLDLFELRAISRCGQHSASLKLKVTCALMLRGKIFADPIQCAKSTKIYPCENYPLYVVYIDGCGVRLRS